MPESAIHIVEQVGYAHDDAYYLELVSRLVRDEKVTAFIATECSREGQIPKCPKGTFCSAAL